MAGEGRDAVLFLDRSKLSVYDGSGIVTLEIPNTLVRDVDVIDKSGFDTLVNDFIKLHKLTSARLWIVLAENICFSKEITEKDPVLVEDKVRDFLEAVPFDQILSKKYKGATGVRIIASNLELLEAVGEIFERNAFGLGGIVPIALFSGFNTRKTLDLDFAKNILASKNLMKQGNMLTRVEVEKPQQQQEVQDGPKKQNKMLPYLIIGFMVLLLILGVVLFLRFR